MFGKGVEPSRILLHTNLNRARLPIPPPEHLCISIIAPSFFYASIIIYITTPLSAVALFRNGVKRVSAFCCKTLSFRKLLRSLPSLFFRGRVKRQLHSSFSELCSSKQIAPLSAAARFFSGQVRMIGELVQ